jgi:hypothetical protein
MRTDPRFVRTHGRLRSLVGKRYGRWIVRSVIDGHSGHRLECVCDCGSVKSVASHSIESGGSLSCGCLQREAASQVSRTHGMTNSPEHVCWRAIVARCERQTDDNYARYGARGIRICQRWRESFAAFYEDMGPRPSLAHSVDRIDNAEGYEPNNCRWATHTEQARNRTNNLLLTLNGRTQCLAAWAEELKTCIRTIQLRIRRGLPVEQALAPIKRAAPGMAGVRWHPKAKKWQAMVSRERRAKYLGLYASVDEAKRVVAEFKAKNPDQRFKRPLPVS